ncbi:hypothetical protein LA080_011493 [Diaporthe eres]|nr:hypothetical protein LA080_011493 [Diaporthe eres]
MTGMKARLARHGASLSGSLAHGCRNLLLRKVAEMSERSRKKPEDDSSEEEDVHLSTEFSDSASGKFRGRVQAYASAADFPQVPLFEVLVTSEAIDDAAADAICAEMETWVALRTPLRDKLKELLYYHADL